VTRTKGLILLFPKETNFVVFVFIVMDKKGENKSRTHSPDLANYSTTNTKSLLFCIKVDFHIETDK
jgi:hypothetical protein